MQRGERMPDEMRARISTSKMGHEVSVETRAKLSAKNLGNKVSFETRTRISSTLKGHPYWGLEHHPYCGPEHQSVESNMKRSVAEMGHTVSSETRAKISDANKGRKCSLETRAKLAALNWKGGKEMAWQRKAARRRTLGFISLNKPFAGCAGHHVDNEQVINMPNVLHKSIWHCLRTGKGMAQMNALAYEWLAQQVTP